VVIRERRSTDATLSSVIREFSNGEFPGHRQRIRTETVRGTTPHAYERRMVEGQWRQADALMPGSIAYAPDLFQ